MQNLILFSYFWGLIKSMSCALRRRCNTDFQENFIRLKVYRDLSEFTPIPKAIVTVGTFDGVHVGHQMLLGRIHALARELSGESVMLTFDPHPRMVLFPDDNDLKLLSTLDEKIKLLEKSGIEHLIIHPFSLEFSRTTALQYVRDMLVHGIGVHRLVIGYDHHFGRNREGSLEQLKEMAPQFHFEVEEIPAQVIDDVNVSSTKIRNALLEGEVSRANEFLGYAYAFDGTVVQGNALGRSIGFPTANLRPVDGNKIIPGKGVYAVKVSIGESTYEGMANIGLRPTVTPSEREPLTEVHLFGFNGDLYGQIMRVAFVRRIRNEIKFKNVEDLCSQLKQDAILAKQVLAAADAGFAQL